MGILDWFSQPSCAELSTVALRIRDPFARLSLLSLQPGTGVIEPGFPSPPYLPVARATFANVQEVGDALWLLSVYNKTPKAFDGCGDANGWAFPAGRARALTSLASYGALVGFSDPKLTADVAGVLIKILDNPNGSKAGNAETLVIYAAAQVVTDARFSDLDQALWLPLWAWAFGGPYGQASIRTRIGVMKALGAILRRGSLTPRQVQSASGAATILKRLVETRGAALPATPEREFYVAEATTLWGGVQAALASAQASVGPPLAPTAAFDFGKWPLIAAGALTLGGIAFAWRRRRG